jgi:hypothetical protein
MPMGLQLDGMNKEVRRYIEAGKTVGMGLQSRKGVQVVKQG